MAILNLLLSQDKKQKGRRSCPSVFGTCRSCRNVCGIELAIERRNVLLAFANNREGLLMGHLSLSVSGIEQSLVCDGLSPGGGLSGSVSCPMCVLTAL